MLDKFKLRLHVVGARWGKYYAEGHYITHAIYFGLACLEGHGAYAVVAAVLVVFTLAAPLFTSNPEV